MDVPGTASLKEVDLYLSAEGDRHIYLMDEPASGQLYRLSDKAAQAFLAAKRALSGVRSSDPQAAQRTAAAAQYLNGLRQSALTRKKPFNPVFVTLPLLDMRPAQPALLGAAQIIFSRGMAAVLLLAALFAIWLSAATSFAFFGQIGTILSLDALLTFALIAPVLKIFHELGHVLAATRYGVPVRRAGIILVALFPMPYVDCTEADFRAGRAGRIVISLAGLLSDLSIALIAFLLWHVVETAWMRQLLLDVVVFSTVTTLAFNLNPLMRLDGYFALSDALHRRNLHTEAAQAMRTVREALMTLRLAEMLSTLRRRAGLVAFALASMGYKIYILIVIAWALLPQYFGVGAMIVVWGGAVMFFTPLLRSSAPKTGATHKTARWITRAVLGGAAIGIAMIPLPYTHVSEITLDLDGTYAVRAGTDGRVAALSPAGAVQPGDRLVRLENIETDVRLALNEADQTMFAFVGESMGTRDQVAAQAAAERLTAAKALQSDLRALADQRDLAAMQAGLFQPNRNIGVGAHVALGDRIGTLLFEAETSAATGSLPEIYSEKFVQALTGVEVRTSAGILDGADGVQVRLGQADFANAQDGRAFKLSVDVPRSPQSLSGERLHVKLTFAAEPLWQHALFLYRRLRLNVLQAQNRDLGVPLGA